MPYKKSQTKKKVHVSGGAKANLQTRKDAGGVVGKNAPTSPILLQNADVKQAQQSFTGINDQLTAKDLKVKGLELSLATERGGLQNLVVDWDTSYDVFVSTARIYCLTDEDAKSLGLPAVGISIHALTMPLGVIVKWDAKKDLIRIRVERPEGLRTVRLEISTDPITATSWKEFIGDGATAALAGYPPGTYWVRAAMVRARERSEYTVPVSVIVGK
jgi:hypothetical protein